MEARLEFNGTGGELFKRCFVGALLSGITLGIYLPWFVVGLQQYIYEKTVIRRRGGDVQLSFDGSGGELFKIGFIGYLLSAITLGIYLPWLLADLNKYFLGHSHGRSADGAAFRLQSDITGGELFKTAFVGYLLTIITAGIYGAWFICKLQALLLERVSILENGRAIGRAAFVGKGGDLFVKMLVGYLLTMITAGIYGAWFQVEMLKFFTGNTELTINGQVYAGAFSGKGGDLFVTLLVGYILSVLTLGIYSFWLMAKMLKFQLDNTSYRPGRSELAAPSPRMAIPAGA